MTTFFIPELDARDASEEDVYTGIKEMSETRTGHVPEEDRIFKLWSRRDGVDCEAEVGKPDPVCGETVVAILNLGRRDPYLIHCGSPGGPITQVIVEKPVYTVTEFTASPNG